MALVFLIKSKLIFKTIVYKYMGGNALKIAKTRRYSKFLDYVKNIDTTYKYECKDYYLILAEEFFNQNITKIINQWKENIEFEKEITKKFNGRLIMEKYPKIQGKELGTAITNFKNEITNDFEKSKHGDQTKEEFYLKKMSQISNESIWILFEKINNIKT